MGDIMPKKRKSIFFKIGNWLDKKLNKYASMECLFCGKAMTVTATEYRTAKGTGSCSDYCAKMIAR